FNTPPDSPRGLGRQPSLRYEGIIPELDIYAIPSHEGAPKKEIYFVALIDVLTHYGVKKQGVPLYTVLGRLPPAAPSDSPDVICPPRWGPTYAALTGAGSPFQHLKTPTSIGTPSYVPCPLPL
ncbi:jg304, partial [Pararge aegeria aegeria]